MLRGSVVRLKSEYVEIRAFVTGGFTDDDVIGRDRSSYGVPRPAIETATFTATATSTVLKKNDMMA